MKRQILKSFLTLVLAMLAMSSYAQDTKEYVDLGLPSGTLWATCNVGASAPEQTGNYYAWGETTPKATYVQTNYAFGDEGSYTKYCTLAANGTVDGKTTLDATDDAATANWGSEWCMPTTAQLEELWSTCTKTSVTQNGVACYKLTGTNGNFILMPKAGAMGVNGLQNEGMLICNSREMETGVEGRTDLYVYTLMPSHLEDMSSIRRFIGVPVRAVKYVSYSLSNGGTTLTITPGANLTEVKTALGDATSGITELYITGDYTTAASINALKTNYFPNLAKVHLTLQTSATSIAASAYSGCTLLTEIVVPNTITSIGSEAFWGCSSLESMTLPFVGGSATAYGASSSTLFGYIFGTSSYTGGVSTQQYYSSSYRIYYIPSSLKSVTITGGNLLYGAFYNCSGLTSITIPENVTSIGNRVFYNCSSLTSITIPENVTLIGERAFYNCSGLTSITIPDGVTSIGSSAFSGCSSLESMTLPFVGGSATATSASSSTLFGYIFGESSYTGGVGIRQYYSVSGSSIYYIPSTLKSVTITGGYLLYGAFYGCSSLTSITIPENVTSIGERAFYNCSGFTSFTIPESVTSIGSSAFSGCTGLTSIAIPNSVASIGSSAFSGCTGLTELEVPASVETIGASGLNTGSENLKSITMLSTSVPVLENANGVHTYPSIYVPAESIDAYMAAENWTSHSGQFVPIGAKTDYAVEVEASNTLSSLHVTIGEHNLQNVVTLKVKGTINGYDLMIMRNKMSNLKHIDLSEARIVENEYEYYTGYHSENDALTRYAIRSDIRSIILPTSLKVIGEYAFSGSAIADLNIPDNVTIIGSYAFSSCGNLTSIDIPDGVTSIGDWTFYGCGNLTNVSIGNGVTSIGDRAFKNCKKLKSINIPNSVTQIGDHAFYGCTSLTSMTLPFVNHLGELFGELDGNGTDGGTDKVDQYYYAYGPKKTFCVPSSLKSVTVMGGNLPYGAFMNLTRIESVTLGDEVTGIGDSAFEGCSNLTNIILGEGITSIGSSAFYNCVLLTDITMPDGISRISDKTFSGCSSLSGITIPNSVTSIGIAAFSRCSGLTSIMIPNGVTSIGGSAFSGCSGLTSIMIPNGVTSIGSSAFSGCSGLTDFTLPIDSKLTKIDNYTFSGCSKLTNMQLPVSVTQIGDYAFQNCTALAEMKIPSSIYKVGTEAFKGCTRLNDVYTYTIEPQSIDQNTFATYGSATLHVPAVSYYNYYYNTQWSRFLKLVNFDEPYDYAFIQNDYEMQVDNVGVLRGNPLFDVWAGGAFILKGSNAQQTSRELHLKCSAPGNKWAALIPQSGTFATTKLYIDIEVNKDFWYAFTFPFDVNLDEVQKEGDWVFRRYDGSMRAADGSGGWRSVEGNTLTANKGYIFRSNVAGTLSIPVSAPTFATENKDIALSQYASSLGAQHANWNFIGNPYTGFYEVSEEDYNAPIVIFNGTGYEAYRPGDDHVALHPFQAFFTQAPVNKMGFNKTRRMSQTESEASAAKANARIASEARMRKAKGFGVNDRLLINLVLSDGENSDKTRIVYNEKQQMGYEAECDAAKFLSTEAVPQLYSLDDSGVKYAINERPQHDGYVQLGYVAPAAGTFTLSASRMDVDVLIHDNVENVTFNLAEGDYTFESEAGTFTERFAMALAEPTAVQSIAAGAKAEGNKAYDLNGRVAAKDARGVVVKNGKKQVVK